MILLFPIVIITTPLGEKRDINIILKPTLKEDCVFQTLVAFFILGIGKGIMREQGGPFLAEKEQDDWDSSPPALLLI